MSYKTREIIPGVFEIKSDIITSCFTNAYVVNTDKRSVLIDTGLGKNTAEVMKQVLTPGNELIIINTHYHWDHIWGNAYFPGARLICHELCRKNIDTHWTEMRVRQGRYIDGETDRFSIDITFNGRLCLGEDWELFPLPGHTDDSIGVYFKPGNLLFVGDIIGDDDEELLPSLKNPENFLESLDKCREYRPDLLLSGHNEIKPLEILDQIEALYHESLLKPCRSGQ